LDRHVLAFDVAGFVQAAMERGQKRRIGVTRPAIEVAYHWHRWLLRAPGQRPRGRRAAEQRDERRAASFDHLVGGRDKIGWKRKPKSVGSTEIDDKIELRGGVDRKIAGVGSAKDTIDVASSETEMRRHIGPVGDEPSIIGIFALWINGGHASPGCNADDCRTVVPEHCVRHNEETVIT